MTISPFLIYLWGIVDNVITVSFVASLLLGFGAVMCWAFRCIEDEESIEPMARKLTIGCIVASLICALIPDRKTIACMVVVPAIANSKVIQQDVPELYKMAVDALKESLTPAKK